MKYPNNLKVEPENFLTTIADIITNYFICIVCFVFIGIILYLIFRKSNKR